LSRVEESATKSPYKLGVGFQRCADKGGKSAPKFIPISNYHKEEETIKSTKAHYLSHPIFKPKPNAHSMCAHESSLHTYRTENGYKITNNAIYNIFTKLCLYKRLGRTLLEAL
jgi:hypothetical protein